MKEIIKENRLRLGLTMKELADRVGVSEATVSRWESGEISNMRRSAIVSLAKELHISPSTLMGWEEYHLPTKTVKIPILGSVPAGVPIEAITNILGEVEIDELLTLSGKYFALKIQGDSMLPEIKDGDVVIVRQQENVENGEIAIVYVNGHDATCKKIVTTKTAIILQPLNPAFNAQSFDWEEANEIPVRIIGKVIEARRFF